MSVIEIYGDDILDVASLGHITGEFNESAGDYIKVEIVKTNSTVIIGSLYSNRLLLKYPTVDEYYLEDYHFHPENQTMGFCSNRFHEDNSISNLKPIPIGNSKDEPLNPYSKYKKQVDIFKDNKNKIYIKPDELLKLFKLEATKYILRIYFLRNTKSNLGNYLDLNKNNLIENGNFFAGLEATQTGDIDRSLGRNNFVMFDNPGYGKFVLEQDGIGNNVYDMRVTGIRPNSNYIFSLWVGWSADFNEAAKSYIAFFENTSSQIQKSGIQDLPNTSNAGSWTDEIDKIISTKFVNGIYWDRRWFKVWTNENADLGSINILLGNLESNQSENPFGRRYFTDLRLEQIEENPDTIKNYINKLKLEEN